MVTASLANEPYHPSGLGQEEIYKMFECTTLESDQA